MRFSSLKSYCVPIARMKIEGCAVRCKSSVAIIKVRFLRRQVQYMMNFALVGVITNKYLWMSTIAR